jgi:hypothetical protein
MDHSESVLANKTMIDLHKKQEALQESIQETTKHKQALLTRKLSLEKKSNKAHQSLENLDNVQDRKHLKDQLDIDSLQTLAKDIELKTKLAEKNRHDNFNQISLQAHSSNEDVRSCKTRKELNDALEESQRHGIKHEVLLKAELAEATRNDRLNAVREKQHHLQGLD